jgi:protein-S-isoprenylcysteine O-methyltransferase Ste14
MWWLFFPSKKTTPAECAVLVVFSAAVFVILGIVALVVAVRAPAEKHELAVALAYRGFWCLGIGIAIAVVYWLFRRLKEY